MATAFYVNQKVRATDLSPLWTAYGTSTTILTGATTNPTLGNSTWGAEYWAAFGLVKVRFNIQIGTTFSAGSGVYYILLPIAMSARSQQANVGNAFMDDFGTAPRVGNVLSADSLHIQVYRDSVSAAIGSGGPGSAWATNDRLAVSFEYEPA